MNIIWNIVIIFFTVASLFTSVYLAIKGKLPKDSEDSEDNEILLGWVLVFLYIFLIILAPTVGEYGRAETSPLPWTAFLAEYEHHGFWSALLGVSGVTIANLWLFWIPAHLIVVNTLRDKDSVVKIAIRIMNFLIGFTLAAKGNPIYKLLTQF